jgi:hypothetical protein
MCIHRERRTTELGVEVQCAKCRDFWPLDKEFFFMNNGMPHSWCKACYRADKSVIAKNERWKASQRKTEVVVTEDQFPCISLDLAVANMATELRETA